jgi:ATP-dependent RNA helicase DDX24/MAK5
LYQKLDKTVQPSSEPKEDKPKTKNDKKEKKKKTDEGKKEKFGKVSEEEWSGIPSSSEKQDDTENAAEEDDEQTPNSNPFTDLLALQEKVNLHAWSAMSLSTPTLQALQALSFTTPTAIQSLAIPRIIQGHDLIGKASTGSGKTLAFGIPILEHVLSLAKPKEHSPVALIIAPTRELSKQIVGHLEDIAKFSLGAMTVVNITGGLSVQKQIRILEKRPSVLVGTPGRLWEVFNSHEGKDMDLSASVKKIQFLVLDEADRLLQDGHFKEVEHILDFVKGGEEKQTLVFSATFQKNLQQKLKGKRAFEGNLMSKDDALGTRSLGFR